MRTEALRAEADMAESDGFKDWYLGYEVVLKTVNGEVRFSD